MKGRESLEVATYLSCTEENIKFALEERFREEITGNILKILRRIKRLTTSI